MIIDVAKVANLVADRMVAEVDGNEGRYEPGQDYESLFEKHFNAVAGDGLPDALYAAAYGAVLESNEIQLALTVIDQSVSEYQQDSAAYQQAHTGTMGDRLRYYGLKQSDFI